MSGERSEVGGKDPTLAAPAAESIASGETLAADPRGETLASADSPPRRVVAAVLPEVQRELYAVRRELARGGMGRILVADDLRLGRRVALKELLVANPALAHRFEREVRVTARLQHPGIVPVYEAGRWPNGEPFYAMKLVTGQSLEKRVRECTTLADRLRLLPNLVQLAEAIAYAHGNGVIHRDLKPANVLVGEYGETVVIDWGLAKDLSGDDDDLPPSASGDHGLTMHGAIVGTPSYMPPEQARGDQVDARADVYSLGALMWHVLAGRPPVTGSSVDEVIELVREGKVASLAATAPEIPRELTTIVDHAMAAEPANRYPSAKELAEDLSRFQAGQLVERHHYTAWDLVKRWVGRHRAAVVATIALIVLGGIIATISVRKVIAERDIATAAGLAALEEQGRVELIAGHPSRAAVYLSEAYRRGLDEEPLRLMLGEAMRTVDASVAIWASDRDIDELAWATDQELVTLAADGTVTRWDVSADTKHQISIPGGENLHSQRLVIGNAGQQIAVEGDHKLALIDARGVVLVGLGINARRRIAISPAADVAIAGPTELLVVGMDGSVKTRTPRHATDVAFGSGGLVEGAATIPNPDSSPGAPAELAAVTFLCGDARYVTYRTTRRQGDRNIEDSWIRRVGASGQLEVKGDADEVRCGRRRALVIDVTRRISVFDETGLHPLDTGGATIVDFALDREGRIAAVGTKDGALAIWDVETGLLLERIDAHHTLRSVAVSPDGRHVASAGDDGVVRVWAVARPPTSTPRVRRAVIARSADGRVEARAAGDHVVLQDGRVLEGHVEIITFVAIGRDSIVAGARDGRLIRWDLASGHIVDSWQQPAAVTSGAIHEDRLVTGGSDGVARLWSGTTATELVGHRSKVQSIAWGPTGDQLLTAADQTVRLWTRDGTLSQELPCDERVRRAWWIAGGRYIGVDGETSFELWDATRPRMLLRSSHGIVDPDAIVDGNETFELGRTGWARTIAWTLASEVRDADEVAQLIERRVPWRLVGGGAMFKDESRLRLADRIQVGRTRRTFDFSGEILQSPAHTPRVASIDRASGVVRDALRAVRAGDRALAKSLLGDLKPTDSPGDNYALAWCRHWLGDDVAAYEAGREAVARWPESADREAVRDDTLLFAAIAPLDASRVAGDATSLGLDEGRLRVAFAKALIGAGRDDLLPSALALPANADDTSRLRAETQLARLAQQRGDPLGAVARIEAAVGHLPDDIGSPVKIGTCFDVPLVEPPFEHGAVDELGATALGFATSDFGTYAKVYDLRYATAARRLFRVLRDRFHTNPDQLAECERQLETLAASATTRDGALDKAILRRGVRDRAPDLIGCHQRLLDVDPALEGVVMLTFTVSTRGLVSGLEATPAIDRPHMRELATCVEDRMKSLVYPSQASVDETYVNYPVNFTIKRPAVLVK